MKNVRLLWIVLLVSGAAEVSAQPAEPIGPYVIDARGTLARFKGDAVLAGQLGPDVNAEDLPTRGLGLAAGAHWYPLRRGRVTFGIGGELILARDARGPSESDTAAPPAGPVVTTRMSGFSPQISLNFGHNEGWSYISGGMGRARLTAEREGGVTPPAGSGPVAGGPGVVVTPVVSATSTDGSLGRVRMINYGGGARWFTSPRLAFTFDVRFYTIDAQESAGTSIGYPRSRFMAISVGASIR